MKSIKEYFEEVETTKVYDGYYYQAADIISIVVLGSLCGLKNPNQLHQWATNERTREFSRKEVEIERIPCYYWFLCLLKLVKPDSLSRCLMRWQRKCCQKTAKRSLCHWAGKLSVRRGKWTAMTVYCIL
ncbi:MAG: transposase family protein [Lawsonibacter sp.]|nr:transposase family protein [Lawsonibacter sp.]